jgi:hypothetical protein
MNEGPYNFDEEASGRALENMGVAWARRFKKEEEERKRLASQLDERVKAQEFKRCHKCDEEIRSKALVCKHCGIDQIDSKVRDSPADGNRETSSTSKTQEYTCGVCMTDYIAGFGLCRCSIGASISEIEFGFLERFGFRMPTGAQEYWVQCGKPSVEEFDWETAREYGRRKRQSATSKSDVAQLGKSLLKGLLFSLASGADHRCSRCGQRLTGALCRYCQQ